MPMRRATQSREQVEQINVRFVRQLADQAFSRAAGASLLSGNEVKILKDAQENYPAWLDAIRGARRAINFESYIIHEDDIGNMFADALVEKAREGVAVRLIYDWVGGLRKTSRRFWKRLAEGGVEVQCYNPPRIDSPLGWISRDHRKLLSADGEVAFVSGLCVGRMWVGYPERGIEPWRDTGVEIRGPAVAEVDRAFAQVWKACGGELHENGSGEGTTMPAGDIDMRVVATAPNTGGLFRLDQLVAAMARSRLWLTDAYYAGAAPFVEALRAASRDGVDVRLLVPNGTDIPILRPLSRAGYRPLLEAGIRVFEWNGPMLHAKTAVADGRWSRVGSTNLNIQSWLGNFELDVMVEDRQFAEAMEQMYEQDLENATEIVLNAKRKLSPPQRRTRQRRKTPTGSAGRATAGALRIGHAIGAAISDHRVLEPVESKIMLTVGTLLLVLAVVTILFPPLVTYPMALLVLWFAVALLYQGFKLRREAPGSRAGSERERDTIADAEQHRRTGTH